MTLDSPDSVEVTRIDGMVTIAAKYAGSFGAIRLPDDAIRELALVLLFDLPKLASREGEK